MTLLDKFPGQPTDAEPVIIGHEIFWQFNHGTADRFGFFRQEEIKKLETYHQRFEGITAYNYHRFNPELEESEWEDFFRVLTDRLFQAYDHLEVHPDGKILGIHGRKIQFLLQHPEAYEHAVRITSGSGTQL